MLRIGCHLSSAKGYLAMGREAKKIDAGTFQFFQGIPGEEMQKKSTRRT